MKRCIAKRMILTLSKCKEENRAIKYENKKKEINNMIKNEITR